MIEILLNGESKRLGEPCSAEDLVQQLDLVGKRIAMEINEEILPRSLYSEYQFKAGDRVEVVHAVGGGAH